MKPMVAQLYRALSAGDCSATACFATLVAVSLCISADAPKPQFSELAFCIVVCLQRASHQLVGMGRRCFAEFSGHATLLQPEPCSGWIFTFTR